MPRHVQRAFGHRSSAAARSQHQLGSSQSARLVPCTFSESPELLLVYFVALLRRRPVLSIRSSAMTVARWVVSPDSLATQ